MKLIILLAFVAVAAARPDDYSRYETFNVDEVINNKRLFRAYLDCFHGTGKCTPEGKDFKGWLPDGIQNNCANCSEKQKGDVAKVIATTQNEYPEDWEKLNKEHNPDGKYDTTLKDFLQKYGH